MGTRCELSAPHSARDATAASDAVIFAKALGHLHVEGTTTRVALPDRVQTWRWRCRELRTFRRNEETTGASVATRLEPGATTRTDATV